jgi:ubiquinone/menaquinone biosynthesis C-methylase UbiE
LVSTRPSLDEPEEFVVCHVRLTDPPVAVIPPCDGPEDSSPGFVRIRRAAGFLVEGDRMAREERWQLAGDAATIYEDHLVPAIFAPWAQPMVQLAGVGEGDRVLDVACGTGVVARRAAELAAASGWVVGLDLNPGMLAVARALPPPAGAPVEWVEASAMELPFPDGHFDALTCQLGMQYLPDRPAALAEMRRVLRRGGRLAVMVWGSIAQSPGFSALAGALERHVGDDAAAIMRAPFALCDSAEIQALLEGAGFTAATVATRRGTVRFPSVADFVRHQCAGSPLAGPVGRAGEEARTALVGEVAEALVDQMDAQGLAFPIDAILGSGRA